MKRIEIKRLMFRNFRGLRECDISFDKVTTVRGANGTGKSTLFNGFLWLLFGKDVQDRKDYEVRTRNADGTLLHEVECSVTGVLDIDGQAFTLKRESVEEWVKPRGQVDRVLKGNHSECWWNETPVKVNEFNARVAAIIEPSLFKMITNPGFFATMDWNLQRAQLFQLAGTLSDAEIAATNPDFTLLLDKLNGKSLADFKKELSAKKSRLRMALNEIQPRIDQTQKVMPENEDFHAIEVEIEQTDKEIAGIDEAIADVTAAIRRQYEAEQNKRQRANNLKSECQQILFDAKTKAQNAAFEANASRRELESRIKDKERQLENTRKEITAGQAEIAKIHREIEGIKDRQDDLRNKWFAENEKTYNGETVCPHCGQELPENMISKAHEVFAKAQAKKCSDISTEGKRLGDKVTELEAKVNEIKQDVDNAVNVKGTLCNELDTLKAKFVETPVIDIAAVVPEQIPEYMAKQKEIADIEATIITDNSGVDTADLQAQKAECEKKRGDLVMRLAKRDAIARCEKEITALEEGGKQLAQMIADAEREEYTVEQFSKTKIEECESRINGLFHNVTFRLFGKTIDGNTYETCIPLVGGVPFGAANTAGQVNAGLDIINTLCRFHGICAPVFFDNAESVSEYIPTESQCIFLRVTDDKKLVVE